MKRSTRHFRCQVIPWWPPYVLYFIIVLYVILMRGAGESIAASLGTIVLIASAAGEVIRRLAVRPPQITATQS